MEAHMDIRVATPNGVVTVKIDEEDHEKLNGHRISIGGPGYPQVFMEGRVQLLHRWIMGCSVGDGRIVDHINRDRLDNRRSNLRFVSATGNNLNRIQGANVRQLRSGNWAARIRRHNQVYELGAWATREMAEAALAEFLAGAWCHESAAAIRARQVHQHTPQGRMKCQICPHD